MAMSERLMKEVELAVDCALQIQSAVDQRCFEVHLDINPDANYKSNSVLPMATGYISSQGLTYRIKPEAFAASTAADYIIS